MLCTLLSLLDPIVSIINTLLNTLGLGSIDLASIFGCADA
jgi:hypothetical protein